MHVDMSANPLLSSTWKKNESTDMSVKGRLLVVLVSVPVEFFPVYSDDMFYTTI